MGPTKVIVKDNAICDAKSGKVIQGGFPNPRAIEDYAARHYIVLPEKDNQGQLWEYEGQPVYCLRGVRYETLNDEQPHLARCPRCGGMGIRVEEVTVERDCLRCVSCGKELDARLEMMES